MVLDRDPSSDVELDSGLRVVGLRDKGPDSNNPREVLYYPFFCA